MQIRKFICVITSLICLLSFDTSFISVNANEGESFKFNSSRQEYADYLKENSNIPNAQSKKTLTASNIIETSGTSVSGDSIIIEETGTVVFGCILEIEQMYNIEVVYRSLKKPNLKFECAVYINNDMPFENAMSMILKKAFSYKALDGSRFPKDEFGNEIYPEQIESTNQNRQLLSDAIGLYNEPFLFKLNKGENSVAFEIKQGGLIIDEINLIPVLKTKPYSEYIKGKTNAKQNVGSKKIEAEEATLVSDSVIHPIYDRTNPATTPSNPNNIVLNTIGSANWKSYGQWIEYSFSVENSGFYSISLRARQNLLRGTNVARRVYIDGNVPFAELESYKFKYDENWYIERLGNKETPFLFEFEANKIHTIRFEVVNAFPEISRDLTKLVSKINSIYRKIIVITGPNPDIYRDYMLDIQMPDYYKNFEELQKEVTSLKEKMKLQGFEEGGEIAILDAVSRQTKDFFEDPAEPQERLSQFKDNISALAFWSYRISEQPLELDYILLSSQNQKNISANKSFFDNVVYSFQLFLSSFFTDYGSFSSKGSNHQAVDVWISVFGRDQANIIKNLAMNDFTKKSKVPVNVKLVQMGLIPATLTGKGPDVCIFINPQTEVVNLAARNVLEDLSKYDGFDNIKQRFHKESIIPYEYMGGYYGVPVMENYPMMFYRTDLFTEFGINPPKNWTDFYNVLKVLQRNNLSAGIPSSNALMNATVNDSMFRTLLAQNNGNYYSDDWTKTGFDSPQAINAFKDWTEFYTKYSLDVEFDAFSRFRTGEMPLVIAPYTFYNQLGVAAPDIKGLWKMTSIPGYEGKDGTINNSAAGDSLGISMFTKTANKKGAYQFIEWFTSSQTQIKYANEIEMLLGPIGRFDTANIEAFKSLPWSESEKQLLLSQWDKMVTVKQTPVSYYMARNISNAFRKVIYQSQNPREALNYYNKDINEEILRKRLELNIK